MEVSRRTTGAVASKILKGLRLFGNLTPETKIRKPVNLK